MTNWEFRDRSDQTKRGDLATEQGNLPEAQRLFGEDLRIAQRLAVAEFVRILPFRTDRKAGDRSASKTPRRG